MRHCTYPDCDCAVSFPDGYGPSEATECPKDTKDAIDDLRAAKDRAEAALLDTCSTITKYEALLAEMQEMVNELADELGSWVEHIYERTKDHGLGRQYERDMDPVRRARALLSKIK